MINMREVCLSTEPSRYVKEWEYAARGGKENTIYPWGNDLTHDRANYFGKDKKSRDRWEASTAPVGSFDPQGFNLLDVAGNVREWVGSDYSSQGYSAPGADSGEKVIRGGDFNSKAKALRVSAREHRKPNEVDNRTGFRCIVEQWPE